MKAISLLSSKSSPRVAIKPAAPVDRRAYFRWSFKGTAFPCRLGEKKFEIRLKDLSRGGACGLVEEPFVVGDYFFIELDEQHVVEAQVRWVRLLLVGVQFSRTLSATFVTNLHERASKTARREEDDYSMALRPRAGV